MLGLGHMTLRWEKHSAAGSVAIQTLQAERGHPGLRDILQPVRNNLKKENVNSMTFERKEPSP